MSFPWLGGSSRRKNRRNRQQKGLHTRRTLLAEGLETRQLLAVDLQLAHDFQPATGLAGNPQEFVEFNGALYFVDFAPESGQELWVTDGTPEGARLAADVRIGPEGSSPTELFVANGAIYFEADDGIHGREMWRTDGTQAGTHLVADIASGLTGSDRSISRRQFASAGGLLYFTANDMVHGPEVWRTDGTATGTEIVSSVESQLDHSLLELTASADKVFFQARDANGTRELYVASAGAPGVIQLTATVGRDTEPEELTDLGGTLYFAGWSGDDYYLWRTDGTVEGTQPVVNTWVEDLTASGNLLYFDNGLDELWRSDGTAENTFQLTSGVPGSFGTRPQQLTDLQGTLYFTGRSQSLGIELWKSDGTVGGTQVVVDLAPGAASSGPLNLFSAGGSLYFTTTPNFPSVTLWRTEGTTESTIAIREGTLSQPVAALDDELFFRVKVDTNHHELWKTLGTPETTSLVSGLRPYGSSSSPQNLYDANGNLVLVIDRVALQQQPATEEFRSFGNPFPFSPPSQFVAIGDYTYFVQDARLFQFRNGSTEPARALTSSTSSSPRSLTNVGGTLFFTYGAGSRLFKSDGTVLGTVEVADLLPDTGTDKFANLVNVGGTLFFTADDGQHGVELWKSDGTAAGTQLVADIRADALGSDPKYLTNVNGTLYFSADDGSGPELWKSDGTALGTVRVRDIALGPAGSSPKHLSAINGLLYFQADGGLSGVELWISDGTELGTKQVADIAPGPAGSDPRDFTLSGGKVFFTADDGASGRELWTTNGIVATRVQDIWPGVVGSDPAELTDLRGTLYFRAGDPTHGFELWSSNGTLSGTQLVKDVGTFASSFPEWLTVVDDVLYFAATTNEHGRELWRTSDPLTAPNLVVPGAALYAEHDPPVAVASDALAWDHDSPTFGGGVLRVTIASGAGVTDELGLLTSDRLTLNGSAVRVDGVRIGTLFGGLGGQPLAVSFNSNATSEAVQLVVRSVSFRAAGDDPLPGTRTLSFTLADGVSSETATATTTVGVRRQEDPPLFLIAGNPPPVNEDWFTSSSFQLVRDVSPADVTYEIVGNTNTGLFSEQPLVDSSGRLTYRSAPNEFGTSQITVRAVSNDQFSEPQTFVIVVEPVNDAPVLTPGVPQTHVEGAPSVILPEAMVEDLEGNFAGGSLRIDVAPIDHIGKAARLSIQHQGDGPGAIGFDGSLIRFGGIPIAQFGGSGDSNRHISFKSTATLAAVQALIRNVTFETLSDFPPPDRTILFTLLDEEGWGRTIQVVMPITPTDDPFTLVVLASSKVTEDGAPVSIGGNADIIDPDGTDFKNGSIRLTIIENAQPGDALSITSNRLQGDQVVLGGTVVGTISYGSDSLLITFNDAVNVNNVEELLKSLQFSATNDPPPSTRRLRLEVTDAGGLTREAEHSVEVTAANDPAFVQFPTPVTVREHAPPVLIGPDAVLFDSDTDNYDGGFVRVNSSINLAGPMRVDLRHQGTGPGEIGVSGNSVTYGGVAIGTLTNDGTLLRVDLNAAANKEAVQALIRNLTIVAIGDEIPSRVLDWGITIEDGEGLRGRAPTTLQSVGENDVPRFDVDTAPKSYVENGPPLQVFAPRAVPTDPDPLTAYKNSTLTLSFVANHQVGDRLYISSSWRPAIHTSGNQILRGDTNPILLGTFTGGIDGEPLAITFSDNVHWFWLLDVIYSVAFETTSDVAPAPTRLIEATYADSDGAAAPSVQLTVNVTEANDAPMLDTTPDVSLGTVAEDAANIPSRTVAGLVSGAITDSDADSQRGIAVTRLTHTRGGTWQYSLNGGVDWLDFGAVSHAAARLLPATLQTRVRYVPNPNFFGSPQIYFRAWDRTQGSAGEVIDLSVNGVGGQTAFSTQVEIAALTITSLNDAPTISPEDGGTVGYTRGTPAVVLLGSAVVNDVDGPSFNGATLIVRLTAGHHATNRLVIGGGFVLEGNDIKLNDVVIGTRNEGGGEGFTRLEISLNENATRGIVQRLVRGLKFRTHGPTNTAPRTVEFTLLDNEGAASHRVAVGVNVS